MEEESQPEMVVQDKVEEVKDLDLNKESNEDLNKESNEDLNKESNEPEWMDIIGSGGLKKKIIKEGICESRPTKGDCVKINFRVNLEDGTEVEVVEDFVFTVGDGEVIHGLDLVMPLMDKGEEAEVYMEARFAYGEKGLDPSIPANSNLLYTICVVDYKPEEEPENIPLQERLNIGIRKRERGNWWFKRDENSQAISCYKAAVDFLDDASDTYGEDLTSDMRHIIDERMKTLNNMAAAQMKIEAYDVAVKTLDSILMCQKDNLKALFRKGKILGLVGEVKRGIDLLTRALAIDPDSKVIQSELFKLKEKARQISESEKSLYRKMLGLKPSFVAQDKKVEKDRYPTLRGIPIKLWGSVFVVLLSILMAYRFRDEVSVNW